jgi:hypothetical protein
LDFALAVVRVPVFLSDQQSFNSGWTACFVAWRMGRMFPFWPPQQDFLRRFVIAHFFDRRFPDLSRQRLRPKTTP